MDAVVVAARAGDAPQLQEWAAAGGNVDGQLDGMSGWTPLHFVAADGNASACQALLSAGADAASKTPGDEFTAAHLAARFGHTAALKTVLTAGAAADSKDAYGHTPLHFAAGFGHAEAALALLSFGANSDATDARGAMPADAAKKGGFEAVLAVLERATGGGRDEKGRLLDWLRAIGMGAYFTAMVDQGFDDVAFVATAGLSEADCDALGVSLAGHRKKLTSLYRISEFAGPKPSGAEKGEDKDGGEDDDDEDDDEDEDDDDDDDDDGGSDGVG